MGQQGDGRVTPLCIAIDSRDPSGHRRERLVLRLFLRGVATTADDDLLRSSAMGKLTDAENLGRRVAAELLSLGASAPQSSLRVRQLHDPGQHIPVGFR